MTRSVPNLRFFLLGDSPCNEIFLLQGLSLTDENFITRAVPQRRNVDNVSRETYGTKNLEKSYPQKRGQ